MTKQWKFKCNCGKSVQAPESMAGKRAKCPGCGSVIVIPVLLPIEKATPLSDLGPVDPFAAAADTASSVTLSRSSVPAPAAKNTASNPRQGLGRVQLGITLVFIGLLVSVVALVIELVSLSQLPLMMVATLLAIPGKVLCLAVPQRSRARGILVVVLGVDVIAMLVNGAGLGSGLQPIWQLIARALPFVSFILFVIFLERLANYICRKDLAESAKGILRLGAGIVGVTIVPFILLVPTAAELPPMVLVLLAMLTLPVHIGAGIGGLYLLFRYAGLLNEIRQAL